MPVTSFIDVKCNADRNIRLRGSPCSSVRMRSSNADSASQASRTSSPSRSEGDADERSESAGDARSRSERSFILSDNVVFTSSCGAGHSANAGLKNHEMTGAATSRHRPEGRRSGDVGGAGTYDPPTTNFRPQPKRRGDDSTPVIKTPQWQRPEQYNRTPRSKQHLRLPTPTCHPHPQALKRAPNPPPWCPSGN